MTGQPVAVVAAVEEAAARVRPVEVGAELLLAVVLSAALAHP
jgi:hypothetical protein